MDNQAPLTAHALLRSAQRNLSVNQVGYVQQHGKRVRRTGCVFYILRRCDIPREHLRVDAYTKLEGTVVLVGMGEVITVYRSRSAYRDICKKLKYRLHPAG